MQKLNWKAMLVGAAIAAFAVACSEVATTPTREPGAASFAKKTGSTVTFSGQGLTCNTIDGVTSCIINLELCGVVNGADVDGPYLLWVFTATGATSATITGPWGTANMTAAGSGTFKYISGWYPYAGLIGNVTATANTTVTNPQLVISHGCAPENHVSGAWCSPGFWLNTLNFTPNAWTTIGVDPYTTLFNGNVSLALYGADLVPDASLYTVLSTSGGTYKGAGVAGTDPRTQPPNPALNPFNAVGAWATDHITGFGYDPNLYVADSDESCPLDAHGNWKTITPQ